MESRQAPYNMGAEQAVLGCMMTKSEALTEVFVSVKAEDFYTEAHRLIFDAAKQLFDTGKPVDLITVSETLGAKLDAAGGVAYLSKLAMSIVWPYPSGLMVGFTADYAGGELHLQREELKKAGWFHKTNLPNLPEKLSIARRLIDDWLDH